MHVEPKWEDIHGDIVLETGALPTALGMQWVLGDNGWQT